MRTTCHLKFPILAHIVYRLPVAVLLLTWNKCHPQSVKNPLCIVHTWHFSWYTLLWRLIRLLHRSSRSIHDLLSLPEWLVLTFSKLWTPHRELLIARQAY